MPLISIIIPVYNNTRTEMERCLNSIQEQGFKDFEIIVLDDGSNAACSKALDDLTKIIPKCRVIHKTNEGVSATRNFGVQIAKGQYITFVDADDILQPYFLTEAVEVLQQAKVDIVYGFVQLIESETQLKDVQREISTIKENQKKIIILSENDKEELYCHMFDLLGKKFRQGKNYISRGPVARILTKSLAEKCPFNTDLALGEDAIWNLKLLKQNPKAGFVKSVWYLYCRNEGSASRVFDKDYKEKCTKMLEKYWAMVTDTPSKVACLRKVFEISRTLAIRYYLTENFKEGIWGATNDFNQLLVQYPWDKILCFSNVKQAGYKEFIKYFLIKINLLLPMFAIKVKLLR